MEINNPKPNVLQEKKYDVVFIGGGPATLSFLSYIFKNKQEHVFSTSSILIIDKSETFGSGCLGKYGINSNTSGEGFLRIISYPDEKVDSKSNLSPNKRSSLEKQILNTSNKSPNARPKDNFKGRYQPLPIFSDFYNMLPTQTLLSFGSKPAPLAAVGYFFDCLGTFIVEHINKTYKKNIFLSRTEVVSVKILQNDDFVINAKQNSLTFTIKSKFVVLANGGRSYVNPKSFKEITKIIKPSDFYTSDYILQENGYSKLITNLRSKRERKVVIIGGAHSGFSSAWILLNGPSNFKFQGKEFVSPSSGSYVCLNCVNCNFNCLNEMPSNSYDKPLTNSSGKNCNKECFGKVHDRHWKNEAFETAKDFKNDKDKLEVLIMYRKQIRVYYHSEEEAHQDGYSDFEKTKAVNKSGNVFPFIGIRGDAKELYRSIVRGREKRVRLLKTDTWDSQKNFITT